MLATHALLHACYLLIGSIIATMVQRTPSVAWLSISRRLPVESYRGVAVSVGGLGTAEKKRYKVFIRTPQALNLLPVCGPGNHWWTLLYNETHCRVAVIWCAFKQPASPHIFILILIKQKTINMIHAHCNN